MNDIFRVGDYLKGPDIEGEIIGVIAHKFYAVLTPYHDEPVHLPVSWVLKQCSTDTHPKKRGINHGEEDAGYAGAGDRDRGYDQQRSSGKKRR